MKYRYYHFVARFKDAEYSGVINMGEEENPPDLHRRVALFVCSRQHLSDMHVKDIVVTHLQPIE